VGFKPFALGVIIKFESQQVGAQSDTHGHDAVAAVKGFGIAEEQGEKQQTKPQSRKTDYQKE